MLNLISDGRRLVLIDNFGDGVMGRKVISTLKNRSSAFFLICLFVMFSIDGFAGTASIVVKQVGVLKDHDKVYALAQLDGNLSGVPECANERSNQASFVVEDDFGKLMYSTLLAAVTAQKQVWISFSNVECGLWGDRPVLLRIDIKG